MRNYFVKKTVENLSRKKTLEHRFFWQSSFGVSMLDYFAWRSLYKVDSFFLIILQLELIDGNASSRLSRNWWTTYPGVNRWQVVGNRLDSMSQFRDPHRKCLEIENCPSNCVEWIKLAYGIVTYANFRLTYRNCHCRTASSGTCCLHQNRLRDLFHRT